MSITEEVPALIARLRSERDTARVALDAEREAHEKSALCAATAIAERDTARAELAEAKKKLERDRIRFEAELAEVKKVLALAEEREEDPAVTALNVRAQKAEAELTEVRRERDDCKAVVAELQQTVHEHCDDWQTRAEKAEAFKAYVHKRLDDAGVPHDPEPEQTAATGCRIEGRLDAVLATRARGDRLQKALREAKVAIEAFCGCSHSHCPVRPMNRELDAIDAALTEEAEKP